MELLKFAHRHVGSSALEEFLSFQPGQRFANVDITDLDKARVYGDFKRALAEYAVGLYGSQRLALYQGAADLFEALKAAGITARRYGLEQSFLSTDEVNLIVLKALHEPMTHERLANDILRCSSNAAQQRVSMLQGGVRLGDMSVRIAREYGGRVVSTVHPILLPLNLSEVYVLESLLLREASSLAPGDPHAVIARGLAEKVHFQLSDYARDRVDARLFEMGFEYVSDTPPAFEADTVEGSRGRGRAYVWAMLEKAGIRVRVTCSDSEGALSRHVGRMVSWEDPSPYVEEGCVDNPALLFVLVRDDGSRIALSWADVVDIEDAGAPV